MPVANDIDSKSTAAIPIMPAQAFPERLFILYYRYGNVPNLNKVFKFFGDLQGAIQRGREHCAKMNYIFIFVRPFVYDLDEQERMKREDPGNWVENTTR